MSYTDHDAPALNLGLELQVKEPAYRVLARKYRPEGFDAVIGQDAMVRTLGNAFALGRIAHAFMLTGVRGVGKTTTARIVAKALNCIGPDGKVSAPTMTPCGQCSFCLEIAESRQVDVLEMDAASRTGIDDIREIVDGVRYAPAAARYKVYIIDEVHMLSKAAFNGLLKTLEEPPPHAKFIFATTEIRKVPITVLSRCQRFDLRRVGHGDLCANLEMICKAEGYEIEPAAVGHIARAAQGSVRDAQSLLDQAMAHAAGLSEQKIIRAEPVRVMLGLADRARVLDLFEMVMRGNAAAAISEFRGQFDLGADPLTVLQDLTAMVHEMTRLKLSPDAAISGWAGEEVARARDMAAKLGMPQLTRTWQILLKALGEVQLAPDAAAAVDMALVRLTFAADLPPAGRLAKIVLDAQASPPSPETRMPTPSPSGSGARAQLAAVQIAPHPEQMRPAPRPQGKVGPSPATFKAVVELAGEMRAVRLKFQVEHHMRLVAFERGRIEINLTNNADRNAPGELAERLSAWTGERWIVSISNDEGEPTLAAQAAEVEAARRADAAQDPLLKAALEIFPGAKILAVRDIVVEAAAATDSE